MQDSTVARQLGSVDGFVLRPGNRELSQLGLASAEDVNVGLVFFFFS